MMRKRAAQAILLRVPPTKLLRFKIVLSSAAVGDRGNRMAEGERGQLEVAPSRSKSLTFFARSIVTADARGIVVCNLMGYIGGRREPASGRPGW